MNEWDQSINKLKECRYRLCRMQHSCIHILWNLCGMELGRYPVPVPVQHHRRRHRWQTELCDTFNTQIFRLTKIVLQRTNNDRMHHSATTTVLYSHAMRTHQITHYFPGFIFFCRLSTHCILFIISFFIFCTLARLPARCFCHQFVVCCRLWDEDDDDGGYDDDDSDLHISCECRDAYNCMQFTLWILSFAFFFHRARTCASTDLYDVLMIVCAYCVCMCVCAMRHTEWMHSGCASLSLATMFITIIH